VEPSGGREGVEKKMRQNPESTFHGCRYQSVPAMVLPNAKEENPNEEGGCKCRDSTIEEAGLAVC
jgi:hypothetical protein